MKRLWVSLFVVGVSIGACRSTSLRIVNKFYGNLTVHLQIFSDFSDEEPVSKQTFKFKVKGDHQPLNILGYPAKTFGMNWLMLPKNEPLAIDDSLLGENSIMSVALTYEKQDQTVMTAERQYVIAPAQTLELCCGWFDARSSAMLRESCPDIGLNVFDVSGMHSLQWLDPIDDEEELEEA